MNSAWPSLSALPILILLVQIGRTYSHRSRASAGAAPERRRAHKRGCQGAPHDRRRQPLPQKNFRVDPEFEVLCEVMIAGRCSALILHPRPSSTSRHTPSSLLLPPAEPAYRGQRREESVFCGPDRLGQRSQRRVV